MTNVAHASACRASLAAPPLVTILLTLTPLLQAEIIDRVAANIGHQVITDAAVIAAERLSAYVEQTPVDLSQANKRKVLDRLIDQALMRKELEFTRFTHVTEEEVAPLVEQVLATRGDPAAHGITLDELRKHMAWTLTMLRFIEYRFQPGVQITEQQIGQEYRRQAASFRAKNTDPPPLEQLRPELEKIVRQRLVDAALDRWLGEMRNQHQILYHAEYKL